MQASGTVTGFTTEVLAIFLVEEQAGMWRMGEFAPDILMTEHAILCAHKFSTGRLWNPEHRPVDGLAGHEADQKGTQANPQTNNSRNPHEVKAVSHLPLPLPWGFCRTSRGHRLTQ